jgi:hypothetical protein
MKNNYDGGNYFMRKILKKICLLFLYKKRNISEKTNVSNEGYVGLSSELVMKMILES